MFFIILIQLINPKLLTDGDSMQICNHTYKTAREHFLYSISRISLSVVFCLFILFIYRLCFVNTFFVEESLFQVLSKENDLVWRYLSVCIRIDLKWVINLHLPIMLLGLLCPRVALANWFKKIFPYYFIFISFIISVLSVVNYFYYKTYDRNIDPFFFGVFREDVEALIKTILAEFSVFTYVTLILIVLLILFVIFDKIGAIVQSLIKFPTDNSKSSKFLIGGSLIVLICFVVCLARGSLGYFPLREADLNISTRSNVLNASCSNAMASLYWASKWYQKQQKIALVSNRDIINAFFAVGLKSKPNEVLSPLKHKTKVNTFLATNKPHVVLFVMESMSSHMLRYDSPEFDLLGELRKHVSNDYFNLKFISHGNGTIESMTNLILGIPDINFSTSSNFNKQVVTNMIRPYKEQGYRVLFVSSGNGGWRNIKNMLLKQGVDMVYDSNYILSNYPEVEASTWGVEDKYMFDVVYDLLKESEQPTLVIGLSSTHHPPYNVPNDPTLPNLVLPESVKKRFVFEDNLTVFSTFRYANNELGKFISKIKDDSVLSRNTFISFTGDHNQRGIAYNSHLEESVLRYSVPFYLYVPRRYREFDEYVIDGGRISSHMDIAATLINHTLSGQKYYSFGCDIFRKDDKNCSFPNIALNNQIVMIDGETRYLCPLESSNLPFRSAILDRYLEVNVDAVDTYNCTYAKKVGALEEYIYYYQMNNEYRF